MRCCARVLPLANWGNCVRECRIGVRATKFSYINLHRMEKLSKDAVHFKMAIIFFSSIYGGGVLILVMVRGGRRDEVWFFFFFFFFSMNFKCWRRMRCCEMQAIGHVVNPRSKRKLPW
ncbi:hypothetical protein B9Z19DRAFT_1085943 [Tuber borchii]|uniref:Transmembrane protein n=1 Tax=Tuber borchii TaxID=42251 RepID=A0A2T6ZQ28_TUBBO|nr:hypothetical protein B9Z19DRAFT_1085943 [Tuber borchii]